MKTCITFIFILISIHCFSQKETAAIYNYSTRNSYKIIDSFFKLEQNVDFELIIQTYLFRRSGADFFVLSSKNKFLTARFFNQIHKDSGYAWREYPLLDSPKVVYDRLLASGLRNIDFQKSIKDSLARKHEFVILDGVTYNIQITEKGQTRTFNFHCPKTWANKFPEIKEFTQVAELLKIMYLAFGFKDHIKC